MLRERTGPERAISVVHTDVPENDFTGLFATLATDPDSYAAFSHASVFPTLAAELDGGRDDPRAAAFVDRLEAAMTTRLATAPEPMLIPLAKMLLEKQA